MPDGSSGADRPEQGAIDRRRQLRREATRAERLLWGVLRGRRLGGVKFRRQVSIGPFIVDFVCFTSRLIVEVDGDYHDHVVDQDQQRQRYLEGQGFKVVRYRNDDVLRDLESVRRGLARLLGEEGESA